ncbi:MAG: hypothetical protein IPL52_07100 [Flavobacteriales bacterium]|nr:hypothetical protein [Flavobacteriales bacterium]
MHRLACFLLVPILFAVAVAPSLYLLQFQVRRAYIERELCVQRDVMAGMRTCHGECQLSKKFRALEQEAAKDFPAERLGFRTAPMLLQAFAVRVPSADSSDRCFPPFIAGEEHGFHSPAEPVPWC